MSTSPSLDHEFSLLKLHGKKKIFHTCSIVWLDKEENITVELQKKLRESIEYLKILKDPEKCVKWIERRSVQEMVIIIIADTFVNQVLPHIHSLPLIGLYIHCSAASKEEKDEWTIKYNHTVSVISICFL
jgi:hypothetical protein